MADRPVLNGAQIASTGAPCPTCAAEGHTTYGGNTPELHIITGGDGRAFCLGHGYVQR